MSSMTFGQKIFRPTPPEKGSFPLDHEGLCKKSMIKFMQCLSRENNNNSACREETKEYLDCRMKNNLMAREEWSKLGFSEDRCTGSVATIKLFSLITSLLDEFLKENKSIKIRVIVTEHAKHFFQKTDIPDGIDIFNDQDEWTSWTGRGDPVLHIELGKWADLLLIAPLDANTLAKISNGICDNLLTCTVRAWEMNKPLLFCPAMNTKMYKHPLTDAQISTLKSWGYLEVPVIEKVLICGDTGLGAMAEIFTIVETVKNISKTL